MSKWLLLIIGVLGLIAITLICTWRNVPKMEADLTDRSTAALSGANLAVPDLAFDGRDATLKGEVASEGIKEQIGKMVGEVYGVRVVNNLMTVAAPKPVEEKPAEPVLSEAGARLQEEFSSFFRLNKIQFANNSARLLQPSYPILDQAVQLLNKLPGAVVEIQGHTDNTGSSERNTQLSQQRAEAVRDYLIGKGIVARRLTAKGYGSSRPVESNDSREGRDANRRVEFKILEEN